MARVSRKRCSREVRSRAAAVGVGGFALTGADADGGGGGGCGGVADGDVAGLLTAVEEVAAGGLLGLRGVEDFGFVGLAACD